MGLDITAYRQLTPATDVQPDEHGDIPEARWDDTARLHRNPEYPSRDRDVPPGPFHHYAESMGFRAGSYGGYNGWREWLAKLAGYPTVESGRHQHSSGAWAATEGPFWELIHFSDCEGLIGPSVSAKLAKDFAEWEDRASAADDDGWNIRLYRQWRDAFEMAADAGAVEFH